MDIHQILTPYIEKIPGHLEGPDRQWAIHEEWKNLTAEEQGELRELLHQALRRMVEMEASDIDLGGPASAGSIWYRVHGAKKPYPEGGSFSIDETNFLLQTILTEKQMEFLLERRNLDFSYSLETEGDHRVRFRGDMYFDLGHLALNMRLITNEIRPFKGCGFDPEVVKSLTLIHQKHGLTLVTGITGSGKSTTLDSIIDANNMTADAHVVIIASPVETIHESKRCIIRHREVGRDVRSFKEGAIQALRQDPDIVVIGEMRDPDTIMTALEITDSGHKVLSTLHTGSAVETIDRIIAECPPEEQDRVRERLADVLTCVVSQKLLPSLDGKRVLAREVLLMNASVRAAIKNNNTGEIYQMIHESSHLGMNTMEQDLKRLVDERRISVEEGLNYANNKKRFKELMGEA